MAELNSHFETVPFVPSPEYAKFSTTTLAVWNPTTKKWLDIPLGALPPTISIRYTVRDSGIHIIVTQRVDLLDAKKDTTFPDQSFGRLASLVYTKTNQSGPILFHLHKSYEQERRGGVSFMAEIFFRVLDNGILLSIDPEEPWDSNKICIPASNVQLARNILSLASRRIRGCWIGQNPAWVRLKSTPFLNHYDPSLQKLREAKTIFRAVSEGVLPWNTIVDSQIDSAESSIAQDPQIPAPDVLAEPAQTITTVSSVDTTTRPSDDLQDSRSTPPARSKSDELRSSNDATTNRQGVFPSYVSDLEYVEAYIWDTTEKTWRRSIERDLGDQCFLLLGFQLLWDGLELHFLHQIGPSGDDGLPPKEVLQTLAIVQWRLRTDSAKNIPYFHRQKGEHRANYYFELPPRCTKSISPKGGDIFPQMVEIGAELVQDIENTLAKSTEKRWLCIKPLFGEFLSGNMGRLLECPESRFSPMPTSKGIPHTIKGSRAGSWSTLANAAGPYSGWN
ncbi:hypothetical protein TWF694_010048 [Orbilia ellipsospora]|uniref:Uncharacterized protein n=1 Tax=Orbilia ellipsospora TaxID=2528407 RepID=A0AAV9X8Q0_9PEZI